MADKYCKHCEDDRSWRLTLYTRRSENVFFLLPALAVGVDMDGRYFLEVAWLCWAVGIGDA